ncbi:Fatty acid desaturase [Prescottella equi NBRC 101255 = C 7]|nr:Fatty acid desaturase [Prescottella equi NBRC 101255 = C 7]
MGDCAARPLGTEGPRGRRSQETEHRAQSAVRGEDRPAGRQGLRAVPGSVGPGVEAHAHRECDGEPRPQPVGLRGDLLRSLPGRGGEVHGRAVRERDSGAVVPAADARQRQHRRGSGDGVPDGQPQLPDRASPVPGSAVEPLRRDRRPGAGAVRQVRPAVHLRAAEQAVPAGVADDPQARAARPVPQAHLRRRARDVVGAQVRLDGVPDRRGAAGRRAHRAAPRTVVGAARARRGAGGSAGASPPGVADCDVSHSDLLLTYGAVTYGTVGPWRLPTSRSTRI